MNRYPNHTPILLFSLGSLQVYHYQSPEETAVNAAPKIVYWQDITTMKAYGPFESITATMNHYRDLMAEYKKLEAAGPLPDNIIYVDFKAKKRIKPFAKEPA